MHYELFYYKKQVEIDFVIYSKGGIIELIQVSESLKEKRTFNREVRALIQASSDLKPKSLKIITLDEEFIIEQDSQRITVVPVIKWLMNA